MRRIKSVRELVWASWGIFLALMVLGSNGVQGQGILVIESDSYHWHLPRPIPRPPVPEPSIPLLYRVKSVEIDAKIVQSVVRVQMSQTFVNEGSQTVEARCIMPVPYDAVVDGITFMVDGKEIEGKILPVDEARRVYQSYVRKSQDPALVQWIGSGLLQTQVFPIPPEPSGPYRSRTTMCCARPIGWLNGLHRSRRQGIAATRSRSSRFKFISKIHKSWGTFIRRLTPSMSNDPQIIRPQ